MTAPGEKPVYEYLGDPHVTEFVCCDCQVSVFGVGANVIALPPRCGTCQWLADIEDPVQREQLRAWLAMRW